jgi:type II secretory pathway component PulF
VNFTLLGAFRRLDRHQQRSEFYRSWEVVLREQRDIATSVTLLPEPQGAEMRAAHAYLQEGVAKGRPVGVIAKLRPDLFPVLDQMLLGAGESFGTLNDSCRLLSEYYLHEYERMTRVRGWTGAPMILYFIATFAIPFPLVWDRGTPAYSAAIATSVIALFLLGGVPVSLLYSFAERRDSIRRPRFAWTLAMGLEGGLTFAGALRLAATVSDMTDVGRALDRVPPKELKAMTLTKMCETAGVWPAMLEQVRKADEASEYLSTLRVFAAGLESPP